MPQRPLHTRADLGVIVRVGEHPLRGALEDGQLLDIGSDGRGHLEAGGAGADHHDVLARQIDRVVPARGVKRRPGEALGAGEVGHERLVELAHGADHRPRPQYLGAARGVADGHRPVTGVVVPGRRQHLGVEPDVLGHTAAFHHLGEVVLQLGLAGEELRPVIRRLEAVAVEVVAHIHPRTGIAVLPPGSAHARVLLDHRVGHPGLGQPDRGQQSGLSAADHDHWKLRAGACSGLELGLAGVAAVESHLLGHHRHVLLAHLTGDQPRHHLLEAHRVDGLRFRAAAVAVITNDVQGEQARRGLVLLGHVALHLVEEQPGRLQRPLKDRLAHRLVIGHVHTRQQQRRDRHILQGNGYRGVGVGERFTGVRVAHGTSWEMVDGQGATRIRMGLPSLRSSASMPSTMSSSGMIRLIERDRSSRPSETSRARVSISTFW